MDRSNQFGSPNIIGYRLILRTSAALYLGCVGSVAFGQSVSPAITTSQATPAISAPAATSSTTAPATGASNVGIGDIIVTATRRSERLSDVPIAVSAFSQATLQGKQVETTIDLANVTPGLAIQKQGAAQVIFLRGVGTADGSAGQEAAVATYIDGVYIINAQLALTELSNIDHVEVLKGPQGTLYGRNAPGGLINIITRTPSVTPELDGNLSYGSYQTVKGQAYATGGLGNGLAADFAAAFQSQGIGYGRNLGTGQYVYEDNYVTLRSKLVFDQGGSTRITLSGDYTHDRNSLDARTIVPGVIDLAGNAAPAKYWDTDTDVQPLNTTNSWGTSLRIEQGISSMRLISISGYRHGRIEQISDNDGSVAANTDVDVQEIFRTFTQELQLQSDPLKKLTWIIGAYYMHDDSGFADPLGVGIFGASVGGALGISNRIRTNSYSAFADGTYHVSDRLRVSAGFRYTADQRELYGNTYIFPASDANALALPVFVTPQTILTIPTAEQHATFKKPSYRVSVDYKPIEGQLVYASYNRGFKSGNFNAVSSTASAFNPETIDAYEVGAKGHVLGILRYDIAGYYYNYTNMQLPAVTGATLITTNAAKSKIYGVDMDLSLTVTKTLSIAGGVAWNHARYTDYTNAQCTERLPDTENEQVICNASGNHVAQSPVWTFNVGPSYALSTDKGTFSVNALWSYNGGFYWNPDNRRKENPYSLVSGELKWAMPDNRWSVAIFGRNLFNTKYETFENPVDAGDQYVAGAPRTVGVRLSFKS